jgi:hypothetical protein
MNVVYSIANRLTSTIQYNTIQYNMQHNSLEMYGRYKYRVQYLS